MTIMNWRVAPKTKDQGVPGETDGSRIRRDKALIDIQRKMFSQFSRHTDAWQKAMSHVSAGRPDQSRDVQQQPQGEESCSPQILTDVSKPVMDIKDEKQLCLDTLGISYIPRPLDPP